MEFNQFKQKMSEHLQIMLGGETKALFRSAIPADQLWDKYLDSFPPEKNQIYRERREHDCSACRQFVRAFGGAVTINGNYQIKTIWDFDTHDDTFQPVISAMRDAIRGTDVQSFFLAEAVKIGTGRNFEHLQDGHVKEWQHLFVNLPSRFVVSDSVRRNKKISDSNAAKGVFQRSLEELSGDAVDSVLDLISQNSLYKGEEWKAALSEFQSLQQIYLVLPTPAQKENFCWYKSSIVGPAVSKIRNHSIGTLLIDITAGVPLDVAVRKYESVVAPANYKRPKAVFTKKMVEAAQKTVEDLGLSGSLARRFAVPEDVKINDVMFADRSISAAMVGGTMGAFDALKQDASVVPKSFDRVESVPIQNFTEDILVRLTSIEVLVENRHQKNLVSLIAPADKTAPSLLKWDNGFSWAYRGNITDSMKERVKALGGKVDGCLRFSIQWNEKGDNQNDLDAHCIEPPNGNHIYFSNKGWAHPSSGMLDVDIIEPRENVAVENIIYTDINRMPVGTYQFSVHTYTYRSGRSGFTAEIEFDGQIHSYEHRRDSRAGERVHVAEVTLNKDRSFSIKHKLSASTASKEIWGLKTQQFAPVSMMMLSPNYWGENRIGNKHYIFALKGCQSDETPNGFFNEFLRDDFIPHRKVFEALSSKMHVQPSENQLSGLGFSSTQKESLICKIVGKNVLRLINIIF